MREKGRGCLERTPPRTVVHDVDVGVFSNPIQGLCKLRGIFKLAPSPTPAFLAPSPTPAFPIKPGDNHPMTSSKKTCVPQEARGQASSYPAWSPSLAGDLERSFSRPTRNSVYRERAGFWVSAVAQNHRHAPGSWPPSFSYLWPARSGKQATKAPKERVNPKAAQDVAF